ncbi:hypothetical protein M2281_000515 [Mesorhizobium soli]|uniref:hypothetical protein n=1 Tax=Pseudaminobacter soli (ex Li et al. 2025) TaxID=1295366 RepID=UPI002473FE8C|nr:hypothetical protein [Mesorhizobium soli]MDH6229943.1 hypothetical protein [Mesorhizobium soli]
MRTFLFVLIFVGAALGFGYPWAAAHLVGYSLGVLQVYNLATGYHTIEKQLSPDDAPVQVLVDMRVVGGTSLANGGNLLAITVMRDGQTVLAKPLTFADATLTDKSAQTNERVYREDAGLITDIKGGTYSFAIQPGDEKGIYIQAVNIVLRARALGTIEVLQMLGFLLMAAGLAGFIFAVRRDRRLEEWGERSMMAGQDRDDGN